MATWAIINVHGTDKLWCATHSQLFWPYFVLVTTKPLCLIAFHLGLAEVTGIERKGHGALGFAAAVAVQFGTFLAMQAQAFVGETGTGRTRAMHVCIRLVLSCLEVCRNVTG